MALERTTMNNNYNSFREYRAKLRYEHFNNNKYNDMYNFNSATNALCFWDTNFFKGIFNMPCTTYHMRSLTFEKYLNDEIAHPTFNWINMFNYLENLQKHPYFQEYLDNYNNNRDSLFWKILNNCKQTLTGQLTNNQQIWL